MNFGHQSGKAVAYVMDNCSKKNGGSSSNNTRTSSNKTISSCFWTNERHVHFLNSIEATFVRTMFQNDGHHALRSHWLDRQLPDSCESTHDSLGKATPTRQCHSSCDVAEYSSPVRRTDVNSRPLSSHHYDQVVPQLENREDVDEKDKDKGHV